MIRPIFILLLLTLARSTFGAQAAGDPGAESAQHWLMMVATKSTDPARDAQFNEWYDGIDIPDVLQVPGYKRARRGQRVDLPQLPRADPGDDGTYVALYDISSRNIDRTIIDMLMATRKMEAAGRSTDLLKVTERLYFKQLGRSIEATSARGAGKKKFLLLERVDCCRDEATGAQLDDWYDVRHIPDMLQIHGFVRATRYELYRVLMVEPKSAPRFLTVYEVEADSAEQVAELRQTTIRKLSQSGRLTESFVERGTAVFREINDVSAQ
jgi:hypothetical protein